MFGRKSTIYCNSAMKRTRLPVAEKTGSSKKLPCVAFMVLMYGTVHCATKNLTERPIPLAVRNCCWASLPRRLAGAMVHRSVPPATAPPAFPAGRLVSSACRAAGCGFVRADSVRESGAAAPGKCRRCFVRDWPGARRRSAPILPQRGPCGCAASPAPVFSAPARGTRSRVLLVDRGHSALQEAFPLYTVLPKRRGEGRKRGMRQKESHRQRSGTLHVATARVVGTDR